MTTPYLAAALQELTDRQRQAVEWDDGPLLVIAGPGSGKTRVLTCRVARLLEDSPKEQFRVLGLTFTNKAAGEMRTRIAAMVPDAVDRAEICTFHGFCSRFLRQHGSRCGIRPDFRIYARNSDRRLLLGEALQRNALDLEDEIQPLLACIDRLKSRLIDQEDAASRLREHPGLAFELSDRVDIDRIELAYRLYEDELTRTNGLDFNSLLLRAFQLLDRPTLSRYCRRTYRYWLVDEFQDTNDTQYRLLRRMAGDHFRELFAVADEDQTIYEWNGASVERIDTLKTDFDCAVLQLSENFRCPPRVVEAANRLVANNRHREQSKAAATPAGRHALGGAAIEYEVFPDDWTEAERIARKMTGLKRDERPETVVLARTHALLEAVQTALEELGVPTALLTRREEFSSPQMRWFAACLKQIHQPNDRGNLAALTDAFQDFAGVRPRPEKVIERSKKDRVTPLAAWLDKVRQAAPVMLPLVEAVQRLESGDVRLTEAVASAAECFGSEQEDGDLKDDMIAWRRIEQEVRQARGDVPLEEFLQELELRSKAPPAAADAVALSTVHAAKGLEFDRVYLIGLADGVFPSWYSVQRGDDSAAIEEERRSCFVAITRTKKRLHLSRAREYNGWEKTPSRFLAEIGLEREGSHKTR